MSTRKCGPFGQQNDKKQTNVFSSDKVPGFNTYVSNDFHLMDSAQSECRMRAILKMHAHNQSSALM